jgi:hypothetical protein
VPNFFKIYLPLLLILSQHSYGQIIVRSSLSCLGSTVSDKGFIVRQTIGQASNTSILNKEGLVLRQGFQQPLVPKYYLKKVLPVDFALYPNPADYKVLIKFQEEISGCTIYLRDIKGVLLSELKFETMREEWLDIKSIIPGIYIITVDTGTGIGSKKLIIKH